MTNPYIKNFIPSEQQKQIYVAPPAQNRGAQSYTASAQPAENNSGNKPKHGISPRLMSKILPEESQRGIVKENVIERRVSNAKGLVKTYGYFSNAMIKGEGKDYNVGRINDGAKVLGSLGIAAALASSAKSSKSKLMEFVGFAAWFGSMSFWPEVMNKAIKVTKRVDLTQEYIDSYGRKKRFFEDSQYLTWDLYKNKDIDKIGDKLGVPKDIKNRSEAIKEKAKQVSVQGNTLMLLTAGFATPVISSLAANYIDKFGNEHISNLFSRIALRKAESAIKGLDKDFTPEKFEKAYKRFESYFNSRIGDVEGSNIAEAWVKTPIKLLAPLKIEKKLKQKIAGEENGHERAKILSQHLLDTFSGDSKARNEALASIAEIIEKPLDVAEKTETASAGMLSNLRKALNSGKMDVVKYTGKLLEHEHKIKDRTLNTKGSFYKLISIFDFMNTHNEDLNKPLKMDKPFKEMDEEAQKIFGKKKAFEQMVFSITSDDAYNGFEKLYKLDGTMVNKDLKPDAINLLKTVFPEKLDKETVKAINKKANVLDEDIEEFSQKLIEKLKSSNSEDTNVAIKEDLEKLGQKLIEKLKLTNSKTANEVVNKDIIEFSREIIEKYKPSYSETANAAIKEDIENKSWDLVKRLKESHEQSNPEITSTIKEVKSLARTVKEFSNEIAEKMLFVHPTCDTDGPSARRRALPQRAGEWGGKPLETLIFAAAKESLTYKTWLKRSKIMGGALVGVTAFAIATFGSKNQYNRDIYEYENKQNKK